MTAVMTGSSPVRGGRGSSATKRSVWSERKMTKIPSDTWYPRKDTLTSTVGLLNSNIDGVTSGKERNSKYNAAFVEQSVVV